MLLKDVSVGEKAQLLAKIALKNGSKDNMTVCLCAREGSDHPMQTYGAKDFLLD